MIIIAFIVFFCLFVLGLANRKSKILSILLLVYMWILIGLNTQSPDYASYESIYNGTYYGFNVGIGFQFVCWLSNMMGFTYQTFRMLWAGIYVLLIANYVLKCTDKPNYVFSMLLLFPILLDVSSLRSSMAFLIVMNFSLLLKKPTVEKKVLYILGTILSATIHITAIFFLIYILIGDKQSKKKAFLVALTVFLITICIYTSIFSKFMGLLYNWTGMYMIQKWLLGGVENTNPNLIGILSVVLFLLLIVCLAYKEKMFVMKDCVQQIDESRNIGTCNYLTQILFYMLYLIPAIIFSTEARRLLYATLIAFYCLTANCFSKRENGTIYRKSSLKFVCAQLIIITGMLLMYIYSYSSHDVFSALYNNLLFGG